MGHGFKGGLVLFPIQEGRMWHSMRCVQRRLGVNIQLACAKGISVCRTDPWHSTLPTGPQNCIICAIGRRRRPPVRSVGYEPSGEPRDLNGNPPSSHGAVAAPRLDIEELTPYALLLYRHHVPSFTTYVIGIHPASSPLPVASTNWPLSKRMGTMTYWYLFLGCLQMDLYGSLDLEIIPGRWIE